MYVHLRPRLSRALDMLRGSQTVADIGSDHGRLAVALLQQGAAERVIACDIRAPSPVSYTHLDVSKRQG